MMTQVDVYNGLLLIFNSFPSNHHVKFIYKFDDYKYNILKYKYKLESISGNGTSLENSIKLMQWLYSILIHDPNYVNQLTDNSLNLLDRLYNKKAINCRATAIILTECLLAIGIPARSVWLMPFSPYDRDCHVVSMAFCKELNKWITLDATVNSIIMDKNMVPLDPIEIREKLENMELLEFSNDLCFYRIKCSYETQKKGYYTYLSKNTFYFKSYKINCFGYENIKNVEPVFCMPNGFDYERQRLIMSKYNNVSMEIIKNKILCSKSSFVATPSFNF